MERENTQSKRGYSERSRRSLDYDPRNSADGRGYGTCSFDSDNQHKQYIDQESLRRRSLATNENSAWPSRAANDRNKSMGYVQGRQGDWSQFESQEGGLSAEEMSYSRARSSRENSYFDTDQVRYNDFRQPRQVSSNASPIQSDYYDDQSRYRGSRLIDRSGPYTGKGPKGYKRSDERIVEEACLRLERAGDVDASEVEVTCEEGVITLRGKIEDRASKRRAEESVEDIYGVRDIMNELQVSKGLFTNLFDASDGNVTRDELLGKL